MALKFCPNCGNKLEGSPKFCPSCGYNLSGGQDSGTNDAPQQQAPKFNINTPAPNAVAGSGGLNRDFKEGRILEYKRAMGLTSGIDNVLIAQIANAGKIAIWGGLAAFAAHLYIMSFEDDGIVMMGITKMGHFNGKNVFISAKDIDSTSFHKGLAKKVITIMHAGAKLKLYVNTMAGGSPFQHANYKNIDNLLGKYSK